MKFVVKHSTNIAHVKPPLTHCMQCAEYPPACEIGPL